MKTADILHFISTIDLFKHRPPPEAQAEPESKHLFADAALVCSLRGAAPGPGREHLVHAVQPGEYSAGSNPTALSNRSIVKARREPRHDFGTMQRDGAGVACSGVLGDSIGECLRSGSGDRDDLRVGC